MTPTRSRRISLSFALLLVALQLGVQPWTPAAEAAPPEGFAALQIGEVWRRDDGPVANGREKRTWLWGPGPFYTNYEPWSDAPQGNQLVQYFDKGRLEINNPDGDTRSPWYVTSGLLVREMISGQAQTGAVGVYKLGPAPIAVAGDTSMSAAPTYATFSKLRGKVPSRDGQPVTAELEATGATREIGNAPTRIQTARFEEATGHNWADVFWRFANAPDRPAQFNWLYTLGYPITEPYWVQAPVNGKPQVVLVQLFERRTLTYNPANPTALQVEMGNVGRHYYNWRYGNTHEAELQHTYDVKIEVGPAPIRAMTVREGIFIKNRSQYHLPNVVLRAVWRHWDGVFTLKSARVNGTEAKTRWLHGMNLEVSLPGGLPPGSDISLNLQFEVKPRPVGGRTGYDRANDILSLGDMLPTVVPWENGGWSFYPYSRLGDLGYYSTSDYFVEVASAGNERLVVGGTGEIEEGSGPDVSWFFSARGVRDVAYVVSPRFINPLEDRSMARQEGSARILAYFLPANKAAGQKQLELVAPAMRWFSQEIGAYPHSAYTVAEMGVPLEATDNYAQEYPAAYFIPTSWLRLGVTPGHWTWYIPVHEVGHQWFYSTVGSNQLTDPWLDEAMTTYITAEYVRANYPDLYSRAWVSMSGQPNRTKPVSAGVFSGFADENQYSATVYNGGAQMLNRVHLAMGDRAFYAALRDYYRVFAGKRAKPSDLLSILARHSNADLKAIFTEYLGY